MAKAGRKLAPRKVPKQERSQATVEAILQAAAYILVKQGWDALTTNRIAERAGVNIASLYQYFANKESIVVELQRRHVERGRKSFAQALPDLRSRKGLRQLLAAMVEAGVREHRAAPALHRAFSEEIPRSARARPLDGDPEALRDWNELMAPHLRNVPDPDLAGFVTRTALKALIHEAASSRPELLAEPRFVSEIVALLVPYLRRPIARRAGDGGRKTPGRRRGARAEP